MNIEELQRRSDLGRKLRLTMENQKLLLDTLYLASQQLWSDDQTRTRCDDMMRQLAREAVKTARQWIDLEDGKPISEVFRVAAAEEEGPSGLPF